MNRIYCALELATWLAQLSRLQIEMYLRTGFLYLYISFCICSHLKKLSMVFCSSGTFSKEKCNILYLQVTRGWRNIFPWRLVKKDIRSRLIWGQPKFNRPESSQKRISFLLALVSLMKVVLTWQYIQDTELNMPMACFGDREENVRTLYMEIARASQGGRGAILEMSKEIMSNCNRFVPVGKG